MNYNFELRKDKTNKDGLVPIRMIISHGKVRIRKNIEAKCLIEHWNSDSNIISCEKKNKYYEIYQDYNSKIVEAKNKVDSIFKFFQYNKMDFQEEIFIQKFEGNKVNIVIDFFEAFQEFIELSKLTKAIGTIKKYTTTYNYLIDFKNETKYVLRFDTINRNFEEKFMDYCFNKRQTLNNYYGKLISIIKTFLQWSFDREYHNCLDFKKIKRIENEIEVIFLSYEELMLLYNYKFENKALERSKDFYCFGCFTGLRHSDIYNLSNANILNDKLVLNIIKTKTTNHQIILNKFSKELLDKYKDSIYKPLPKITSQKLNKNIQKCCEIIGLDQDVTLTRFIGSKRINQTFKKHELITSHTARKTFITNSLMLGINERVIKATTNSKDEKSFKRYIKVTEQFVKKEMDKWN